MRPFIGLLILISAGFMASQAAHRIGIAALLTMPAIAQEALLQPERPVEKMSVEGPTWERAGALLVVDVTVNNGNQYPVRNVIIACDLLDERGARIGSRGTAIHRMFQPGKTRVSGLQFLLRIHNVQIAGCRVLSAKRILSERGPQS